MNRFRFVVNSRGFKNSVERAVSISGRFGFHEARFLSRLERFAEIMREFGGKPSFPISTILLARYPRLNARLRKIGAAFLSHGHTHVDYAKLSSVDQRRLIRRSRELLLEAGAGQTGFRAPYLHWNEELLTEIARCGFLYDSSAVAWWPLGWDVRLSPGQSAAYQRSLAFYQPFAGRSEDGMPYFHDSGLLEIPVTLPDDEMLIDRLRLARPSAVSSVWHALLEKTYAAESLFNLQLHPERILLVEPALRDLLRTARGLKNVWLATLDEIHQWFREKRAKGIDNPRWPDGCRSALCISGDIDCATIQDFFWRFVEKN